MKKVDQYEIYLAQLKNQDYSYDYSLDAAFFELYDDSPIKQGVFDVHLDLIKSETMLQLDFHIQGQVELVCDRSLEPFLEQIQDHKKQIFKFADREEEVSDELSFIPWGTDTLNLAHLMYEYIILALPYKRLHPDYREEGDEEEEENQNATVWVYSSDEETEDEPSSRVDEDPVDPRWNALKKLNK